MSKSNELRSAVPLIPGATGPIRPTPPERLFTRAALDRAWLAVKRAGGGAGVDGKTVEKFEHERAQELTRLRDLLVSGQYQPHPVATVLVPKTSGGLRQIALWALRDRIAQRVVYDIVAPAFEPIFLACSFGFRAGLGVHDAIGALQRQRDADLRWVVHADIQDCFDKIDGKRLMPLVATRVYDPLLLHYIKLWLRAKLLNSADGVPRAAGTSQGSVLSPLLANIYLHQVDQHLVQQKLAYLRYADDFIICCRRKQEAAAALEVARSALAQWGLTISQRKTWIVHFDEGFPWLGYFLVRQACYRLAR